MRCFIAVRGGPRTTHPLGSVSVKGANHELICIYAGIVAAAYLQVRAGAPDKWCLHADIDGAYKKQSEVSKGALALSTMRTFSREASRGWTPVYFSGAVEAGETKRLPVQFITKRNISKESENEEAL